MNQVYNDSTQAVQLSLRGGFSRLGNPEIYICAAKDWIAALILRFARNDVLAFTQQNHLEAI